MTDAQTAVLRNPAVSHGAAGRAVGMTWCAVRYWRTKHGVRSAPKAAPKVTYAGALLLDGAAFGMWLDATVRAAGLTNKQVGKLVGHDESLVRRYRCGDVRVNDRTVEKYGLALEADPRLPARLYPELGDL